MLHGNLLAFAKMPRALARGRSLLRDDLLEGWHFGGLRWHGKHGIAWVKKRQGYGGVPLIPPFLAGCPEVWHLD
ncbi:MAG: hypothetical protein A2283_09930 [Lentisphaerae bacterium RIFOXYA12_FULL_48_11]|nr:MAG: hypothetical protein A2283_09930 [Lentisphaerae bacterium RIFOXYA12_FULL_48_11]